MLIAQLGVETHAYSHLTRDSDGVPSTIQSCGVCLSFAPLLSMAGGAQSVRVVRLPENDLVVAANNVSIALLLPCAAFRARAPPPLL